ncbi:ABC transporter ATP-binding protein [Rubrivivax gelatinosus]|uniref:ATP-binding cassette subfamily B protein n=1 Tax=Rubrivivax gelatinosus TaxID=28068 RepID=A0A4R2MFD2_RUBGE|nr:ABC transporter ATP-binding protein [Rubrivivax gelatinosus]MBK1688924.1 ABC transporter ATP-binding protein/permease [Rubrivivax gelatinosus]TCP05420.1 ATP-binding cassette subfamily B protein [Rubrivivax gelatinosus]
MSSAHAGLRPTPWIDTYRQLLRSAGAQAPALRASLAGLVAAAALQGLALACAYPLLQALLTRGDARAAWGWLGAMAALGLASTALRWRAQGFDYDGRMALTTHELRTRLGEQLRRMPLLQLQDRRSGEVHAMLLGNVDENLNYTLTIVNLVAVALVTPLAAALAVFAFDWRLALALLLVFPAIVPLYRWRRPAFGRGMRALGAAHARSAADTLEYMQGLPALRAACCDGERATALCAGFAELERLQTLGQRKGSKPNVLIASVVELGLLAIAAAGAAWVAAGTLDLALLAATLVLVVRFAGPLSDFVAYTAIFELIEAALERIDALMAVQPLPQQQPQRRPQGHELRLEGVGFAYPDGTPVLRGVDVVLPERSMTAVVGPSGSGKSTLLRLLLRHADPQQGRILLGGVDLRAIPAETLNAQVSVVFQDVYLFDDTVLANIRMARPEAGDEEVRAAARAAQCLDFIERLPQGWQTRLGEIGARLSGGERQRISIARALLKDAPIVVLDEPTAALDTESELAVQRAIDHLVRERSVIVIAHRLSTIAAADRILVLDEGRLVQQGRHDELLAVPGRYRAMWQAQQQVKAWHVGAA